MNHIVCGGNAPYAVEGRNFSTGLSALLPVFSSSVFIALTEPTTSTQARTQIARMGVGNLNQSTSQGWLLHHDNPPIVLAKDWFSKKLIESQTLVP